MSWSIPASTGLLDQDTLLCQNNNCIDPAFIKKNRAPLRLRKWPPKNICFQRGEANPNDSGVSFNFMLTSKLLFWSDTRRNLHANLNLKE